jgi:hypothetical protein
MADSDNENQNEFFDPEEEVGIGGDKKLHLQDVITETGEESEDLIFKIRARIHRWRNDEWKERGTGDLKMLRHKDTKKIRLVLRQDKTLKPAANFYISEKDPLCDIKPHQGSDKMFFLLAYDCSEEAQFEKFVIKLGNAEHGSRFKEAFLAAREFNRLIQEGKESEAVFAAVVVEEKKEKKEEKERKKRKKRSK